MKSEKAVEIEGRPALNPQGGAVLIVSVVAVRHDDVQAIGPSPKKYRDKHVLLVSPGRNCDLGKR
jgi:hypothetical protein